MRKQKTFVLGLGAPKCGTTWLFRYIDALACSNMGCRKEYRVLPQWFSSAPLRSRFNFAGLVRFRAGVLPWLEKSQLLRLQMIIRPQRYFDYFSELANDDQWLTGDISPGYMTMSPDQLRHVADQLKHLGFQLRVVFLLRDPVERCWSSARMRIRNSKRGFYGSSPEEVVRRIYDEPGVVARTRYDLTLNAIDQVFSNEEVFVALYEELFSDNEIKRLSDFLGVPTNPDMASVRVNQTNKQGVLPQDLVNDMKELYRPVYAACEERFPQTQHLWI